ncbi:amidohydrolase [Cytophagales bacterium LB-30]|uniref:Amidohydrolase n=1 Tax=Shiella aurantiaca TaxID=3058365 RepID=A0ABT8F5R2_9BACT|nr:amidohydrolase [Shiella aurantiaca]MDN4165767.1 amidohydrolase [Shiella aurantiaca]
MKNLLLVLLLSLSFTAFSQNSNWSNHWKTHYPTLDTLYKHLHRNPELSLQEVNTSRLMGQALQALGFEVIRNLGAHNVAGILKNGDGPVLLIRTDMDALPLEEKTGLSYASKAKGINAAGNEVFVMHACGHDIHMSSFIGTAQYLSLNRKLWKGTLVMVAQSAEENGLGADLLFKAGFYDKIPTPDYALALHDNSFLPAGSIGYRQGAFMASVDMMDITVYGKGGHGASPHSTIDPIVLSAQMIQAFQTIVSRELNPIDPAVITVGSIHGGTVHNIIPDEVKMQLTIRAYSDEVRDQLIAAIKRIATGLAQTAGLEGDKLPTFSIREPMTPATVNDKALTERLLPVIEKTVGKENLVETLPYMVGEDFSMYGKQAKKVPLFMFWLGTLAPETIAEAKKKGEPLPSLHSPYFAPVPEKTIQTGVEVMSAAAIHLLSN